MVRRRGTGHTEPIMNDLIPSSLLHQPGDAGLFAIALFFGVLLAVFAFRMERPRSK